MKELLKAELVPEYVDYGIDPQKHYVGVATRGFLALSNDERLASMKEFHRAERGDRMYAVKLENGVKIYFAENGERGFTAMLAEEY